MGKFTYREAGVDLEQYRESMRRLPQLTRRTYCPRVLSQDGGFAGLFQLDFANRLFARNYRDPVLVACTDGVGTKLKVAQRAGVHDTVGIDLVAMCVNDALCCGAEPLFFLDYIAMDRDDPSRLEAVVRGISDGCLQADCALLGGETAIMPDLYQPGDYDLAGFCVGVVERKQLIDGSAIGEGDLVLGLASSGLHSNGFSLVRKVVFEAAGLELDAPFPDSDHTVGSELLRPTRIYTECIRQVLNHYKVKQVVHGIAHITGGGLRENLGRILPPHVSAQLNRAAWNVPPVFSWLQQLGEIDDDEMDEVFNMGIGLVLVVSAYYGDTILRLLERCGIEGWPIGAISRRDAGAPDAPPVCWAAS